MENQKLENTSGAMAEECLMWRKDNIDLLRGLMIIFVMAGHAIKYMIDTGRIDYAMGNWIYGAIYTFHMPVFFAIAGYVNFISVQRHKDGIKDAVIKEIFSLYIPYLLLNFGCYLEKHLAEWGLGIYGQTSVPLSFKGVISLFYIPDGISWFLFALFLIKIISTLTKSLSEYVAPSFFAAVFVLYNIGVIELPYIIYYISWGVFFEIGYFASKYNFCNVQNRKRTAACLILCVIAITVGIILFMSQMNEFEFTVKLLIGSGLFLMLLMIPEIKWNIKPLAFLGKNTMIVYIVHGLTGYIAYLIMNAFVKNGYIIVLGMICLQSLLAYLCYLLMIKVRWMHWLEYIFYPYRLLKKIMYATRDTAMK